MRLLTPKNRPYVLFSLWVGIIVTISFWLITPPEMPHGVRVDKDKEQWSLPKANATAEVESAYALIAPLDLFHNKTGRAAADAAAAAAAAALAAAPPAPPPPPPPPPSPPSPPKPKIVWRLSGVINIGGQGFAVIGVEKEHRQYKIGEPLPNGEKLLRIQTDQITISDEGQEKTVKLFDLSNKTTPAEAPAQEPADPK